MTNSSPSSVSSSNRPRAVVIISFLIVLEALTALAAAGLYVYDLLTQRPATFEGAIFTLGVLIVLGVWLLAVSHFLFRGRRWTRAAAFVWQLFLLTIAVPTITSGPLWLGLILLVPALIVLFLLFNKQVISYVSLTASGSPTL